MKYFVISVLSSLNIFFAEGGKMCLFVNLLSVSEQEDTGRRCFKLKKKVGFIYPKHKKDKATVE